MNQMAEGFLKSWKWEHQTTKRVLERLPEEKWDWAPHSRSMPLGKLATHLVEMEAWVSEAMERESFLPRLGGEHPVVGRDALLVQAEEVHAAAVRIIEEFSDEKMHRVVPLVINGREIMRGPVIHFLETVMKSHCIHHRGQLTVYLRLLDLPVPSVYGPSADETSPR